MLFLILKKLKKNPTPIKANCLVGSFFRHAHRCLIIQPMSAPTKGCFEKIDELKPLWAGTIKLVGSAGQFAVQATFPKCSCGLKQSRVRCTLNRNVDQAASDVLVKVIT